MSIQNFYAAAQNMEFARDFQFKVRALGPFTEQDLLYLKTAKLPGKEIVNKETKKQLNFFTHRNEFAENTLTVRQLWQNLL